MPVERKQPDFRFNPGPVRLYLHDLEEIDRLLRSVDTDGKIELEVDNYEATYRLSALEELAKVPGDDKLREIRWSRWWPAARTLTVRLSDKDVYVTGSPALRGALEEVADVLRRRRRPLAFLVHPPWRGLAFWSTWLVLTLLANLGVGRLERAGTEVSASVLGGCVLVVTVVVLLHVGRLIWRPGVVLRVHRHERPSFWRRNRDQLIVGLIAASVGSVFGYVLAYLLGNR